MNPGWHTEGMRYAATLRDQAVSATQKEVSGTGAVVADGQLRAGAVITLSEDLIRAAAADAGEEASAVLLDAVSKAVAALDENIRTSYGIPLPAVAAGWGQDCQEGGPAVTSQWHLEPDGRYCPDEQVAGAAHGPHCPCEACTWEAHGHEICSGHGPHCPCEMCNWERDYQLRGREAAGQHPPVTASVAAGIGGFASVTGDPRSEEPPATPEETEAEIRAAIYAPLGLDGPDLPAYGEPGPDRCPGCLVPHGSSGKCWYCTRLEQLTRPPGPVPDRAPGYAGLMLCAWDCLITMVQAKLTRPVIRLSPGSQVPVRAFALVIAVYATVLMVLFLLGAPW